MNTFLVVLFILIILITIVSIIYIKLYNQINELIVRIESAETRFKKSLNDKFELLDKGVQIIRENVKIDESLFEDIIKFRACRINDYDLDRTLEEYYNNFLMVYEKHKKLRENEELVTCNKKLKLIEEEMITLRKYHNVNVLEYNKLINKFPTKIIAKIKKMESKKIYDVSKEKEEEEN